MEDQSFQYELIIEDDYRKSNTQDRYFFPLDEETNFKINKFFRTITKDKKKTEKIIDVKGRNFKLENFYYEEIFGKSLEKHLKECFDNAEDLESLDISYKKEFK